MSTFIFLVVMTTLGIFFLKLKNESEIEKYLKDQGIQNPSKGDINQEIRKRKSQQIEINIEKIKQFKQDIENRKQKQQMEAVKTTEKDFFKQKKEFRTFTAEEKKAYGEKQREKIKKGKEYEEQIADHFRWKGYDVVEHGKMNGKKDGGIDLIATKADEMILIQCKNWATRKITHSHIKEFLYNAKTFIENNPIWQSIEIDFLYVVSNDLLDKSAKGFIHHSNEKINYQVIPYEEENRRERW